MGNNGDRNIDGNGQILILMVGGLVTSEATGGATITVDLVLDAILVCMMGLIDETAYDTVMVASANLKGNYALKVLVTINYL